MSASIPVRVEVARAKGRPRLSWVGKRPLREVQAFPSQLVERFAPETPDGIVAGDVDWTDWPARFDRGGLLFHGNNDVDVIDSPERRSDVVGGTYDLEAPAGDRRGRSDHGHARRRDPDR